MTPNTPDRHQHTPEEERRIREAALDETIESSFPASDPPSSDPNPDDHAAVARASGSSTIETAIERGLVMRVTDASELHTTWAARFNAKDLDGVVALAEPDSVFVPQPGVVLSGEDAIRGAEQQFMSLGVPITLKVRRVIVSGDIALLISDWTMRGKGADGADVNMSGTTTDVARRGPDGWKYVIDNPFGTL